MEVAVSLVVATVDRSDSLARLLNSLSGQTGPEFEVIVVDQNGDERVSAIVARFTPELCLKHLRSPRGLSLARNLGIGAARGEIVGFPDDDCWYPPGVLERVADHFKSERTALLTGRTTDEQGVESVSRHRSKSGAIDRYNVFVSGNSNTLFVRRSLLGQIGLFNEGLGLGTATPFQSGEETDLVLRFIARGYHAHYDPALVVHHECAESDAIRRVLKAGVYSEGFGWLVHVHDYGSAYLAARIIRTMLRSVLCIARGDLWGTRERWAWALGAFRGYRAARRISGQ